MGGGSVLCEGGKKERGGEWGKRRGVFLGRRGEN